MYGEDKKEEKQLIQNGIRTSYKMSIIWYVARKFLTVQSCHYGKAILPESKDQYPTIYETRKLISFYTNA